MYEEAWFRAVAAALTDSLLMRRVAAGWARVCAARACARIKAWPLSQV